MDRLQINIRIKPDELADWTKRAADAQMTLSAWIREQCSGVAKLADAPPERATRERVLSGGCGATIAGSSPAPATKLCAHGAPWASCKKWGCQHYEIANGRGVR